MPFADLKKTLLTFGPNTGNKTESECDDNMELDGSFFSDGMTIGEMDYAQNALRDQNVYHVDTRSRTIREFQEKFSSAMAADDLSLFKNFDIKNTLALLTATDTVTLTLPVHLRDSALVQDTDQSARDVLNPDDVLPLFIKSGLLKSSTPDPIQKNESGDGYMWIEVTLQDPPTPLQLKALYTLKNKMEHQAKSDLESDIVRHHGVDWATLYLIAQTQLSQYIASLSQAKSISAFSTTLNPHFNGLQGLSAERFDAYAKDTAVKSILGNNEYMRLLDWDNVPEKRFVQKKRLAQYAGMDGEDLSLGWITYMGIDSVNRAEFQKTYQHFMNDITHCLFTVDRDQGAIEVESYFDPVAHYLDITVRKNGRLERIESEWDHGTPHTQDTLKRSGDQQISTEEIFLILFQFRQHLHSLKQSGQDALTAFDKQLSIEF